VATQPDPPRRSPAQNPWENSAFFHRGIMAKSRKITENPGKIMGKSWKIMANHGKSWQIMENHGKLPSLNKYK